MEKEIKDTVIKSRSIASCVTTGYRRFTSCFRRIVRQTWLPAVIFAAVYSAVATWLLLKTESPLLSLTLLYVGGMAAAVVPAVTGFRRVRRKVFADQGQPLMKPFALRARHWGLLTAVVLLTLLISAVMAALLSVPAIIIALANTQANLSTLWGDAYGMPAYMTWLTALVMLLLGFLLAYVILAARFPVYFAYGSATAQEQERHDFNKTQQ